MEKNEGINAPAIIFGDNISAYGAIKGLSRYRIPIHIVSRTGKGLATKSRFVNKVYRLDPHDAYFIEKLNEWYSKEIGTEAALIVAGDDDYLEILSKRISRLKDEMKPTFPGWNVVKMVREKRSTYKIAEKLGVPIPKTYYVTCRTELESLLNDKDMKLNYPMFLKAEDSGALLKRYGTKGVICNSDEEVSDSYERYDGFGGQLLLQDMIPGKNERIITVLMSLNRESEPTGVLINCKKRSRGQFLDGTLVASTWSDTLLDYSLKLARKIGYYGYAGTQFKLDPRDNQFKLMEINGRMSMSNSLALKCGVNLPYLMYQEALSSSLPTISEFKQEYPENVLWWYLANDIRAFFRNRLFFQPLSYLRSLIGRGYTIEPMYWSDPYPGLLSMLKLFSQPLKTILRKK